MHGLRYLCGEVPEKINCENCLGMEISVRLPDDYEEHSSMTPMMVMSIVLVTLLVGVILVVVLLMNNKTLDTGTEYAAEPVLFFPGD